MIGPIRFLLWAHACTILIVLPLSAALWRKNKGSAPFWIFMVLSVGGGLLGVGASALLYLLRLLFSRLFGREDIAWITEISRSEDQSEVVRLSLNLEAQRAAENAEFKKPGSQGQQILSFLDVMEWGSTFEKQRVLNQIARNFSPCFKPVLKEALTDSNNLIRVQAASIVSSIEARLIEDEFELSDLSEQSPHDLILRRSLAQQRLLRAESGLIGSEKSMRETIAEELRQCLNADPDDEETRMDLLKVLADAGMYDRVLQILRERYAGVASLPKRVRELWYEALFQKGDYATLRSELSRLGADPEFAEIAEFWKTESRRRPNEPGGRGGGVERN